MNLKGKIGVYGRSLGGIATAHLIDKVDMVFADRTFCNFDILAKRKFYAKVAKVIFKVASFSLQALHDYNILNKG
jgi:hypothetical protein